MRVLGLLIKYRLLESKLFWEYPKVMPREKSTELNAVAKIFFFSYTEFILIFHLKMKRNQ